MPVSVGRAAPSRDATPLLASVSAVKCRPVPEMSTNIGTLEMGSDVIAFV